MEILAAFKGLEALTRACAVEVVTDSQYLRDGATSWIKGWKARGWRTVSKDSVKNADLWQQLDMIVVPLAIKWTWVRGHNSHPMNEGADARARAGMAHFLGGRRYAKGRQAAGRAGSSTLPTERSLASPCAALG